MTGPSHFDLFTSAERIVIVAELVAVLAPNMSAGVSIGDLTIEVDIALTDALTVIVDHREQSAGDRSQIREQARARLHIVHPSTSNGEPT